MNEPSYLHPIMDDDCRKNKSKQDELCPECRKRVCESGGFDCPHCGSTACKLIAGVCPKCKRALLRHHINKLDVEWKREDFQYSRPTKGDPSVPIMDEEDAASSVRTEAKDFFKREVRLLVQYNGNLRLALYAMCFANEWYDLIECETAVEIAVKLFGDPKKKAAVTKAIKHFQDSMGIEPGRGQRSEKGREQMAKARKQQLCKPTKNS